MLVKGEGDRNAKIWIIGEAPGAQEDAQGRPFVGGAGRVLDSILSDVDIKRSDCYIDNVIQERPKQNDFGTYYEDKSRKRPKPKLVDAHRRLQQLVKENRPNVVVGLGNEALYALTGKKQITKWRGSILGCGGVKVIPTIHPAMVMRQYEFRPQVVFDLKRALEQSKYPEYPKRPVDNFIINPTYNDVMFWIDKLKKEKFVAFDIETQNNQISCIGFGWSDHDAICIPIFFGGNSWWTKEQEVAIILAVKSLLEDPHPHFIAQNAQFDMVYLRHRWGINVKNLWMDTMIAHHCVYSELKKGLDFLCSIYTTRPYYKDMPQRDPSPDNLWTYNCMDTVVTWECAMTIRKELQEFKTLEFYEDNSHKLIRPMIEMQMRGVRIDTKKRDKLDGELSKAIDTLQTKLEAGVGHPLNVSSHKQMKEFLYHELNLPAQISRKTGRETADEDAIRKLASKFDNPIFEIILEIRRCRKLLSTYVRAPIDTDGRIRCSYVITGTETGRLSSRESVYGSGTNLQNIPRDADIRSLFVPDEGKIFVNADLSQAEARVVAFISGEERLQALFQQGGDIHRRNAAMVFSKPIAGVTGKERQLAKTLVHAANYGIGPRTFAKHVGTNEEKARALLNQYYAFYPSIKRWHNDVEYQLRKTRILKTPYGRKRLFFGRWGPDLIREGLAYIPQSTVSDTINKGIIRAWDHLPPEWEIMMQVHDSVLLQVPKDASHMHILKFIKHYFEFPIRLNGVSFTIPVEIKIGENWGSLKAMEVK